MEFLEHDKCQSHLFLFSGGRCEVCFHGVRLEMSQMLKRMIINNLDLTSESNVSLMQAACVCLYDECYVEVQKAYGLGVILSHAFLAEA